MGGGNGSDYSYGETYDELGNGILTGTPFNDIYDLEK